MGTAWVDLLVALLMAATGFHLGHALLRPGRRDIDLTHAAMGAAMAAMLTVGLGAVGSWLLVGLFAGATLWFASGAAGRQALCCVAMAAMLALSAVPAATATSVMPGMQQMAMAGRPAGVLLALALAQAGLALWTVAGLRAADGLQRWHVGAQLATTAGGAAMVVTML